MTKGFYNGFGPKERSGTLATIRAAIADGSLSQPTSCSVCGCTPASALQWHSENYFRPLDAYPICRGCHIRVHARFRHPNRWLDFLERATSPDCWARQLSLDPASRYQPYNVTYADGPFPQKK